MLSKPSYRGTGTWQYAHWYIDIYTLTAHTVSTQLLTHCRVEKNTGKQESQTVLR